MQNYELDYLGFSNEDGDGCVAVFVDFPDVKGIGDTFEEAREDAHERLELYFKRQEKRMSTTFEQGVQAYESKQFNEAYSLFTDAASKDNANAMVNLAVMTMQGRGCARDIEGAKQWFVQAAEKGNKHAMMSLAQIMEKGLDGKADEAAALGFYRAAADRGHVDAQCKAGVILREKGEKVQAMQYLIAAAHNNNSQAQEIITYISNKDLAATLNQPFRSLPPEKQRLLVMQVIDQKIRPTLEADNGGVELLNYVPGETPQIWLNYLGACSGCHLGSTSTADMLLDAFEELIDKNVVLYLM